MKARASLRRRAPTLGAFSLAVLLLFGACTGDELPFETPAPASPSATLARETATPTPRLGPTATPRVAVTPAPPPTSAPGPETYEFTIQLVDLESGEVRELFTSPDRSLSPLAEFAPGGGGVWVHDRQGREARVFSLGGAHESTIAWDAAGSALGGRCRRTDVEGVAEIDGQRFPVNCGLFSPDGDLMAYTVGAQSPPTSGQPIIYQQWLLNLNTGERTQLRDDLQHCGGCDGRAGPAWSPSGRYFMFVEFSGESRTWVTDVQQGTTRLIASGLDPGGHSVGAFGHNPIWSPIEDALLLPRKQGGTIVERMPSGEQLALSEVPWPAAFSDDGRYIFSPRAGLHDTVGETVIVEAASGEFVGGRSGTQPYELLWVDRRVIVSLGPRPALLLENGAGCDGTILHHPLLPGGSRCLTDAAGALFSPTAGRVAFARITGRTGHIEGPVFQSLNATRYEIVVVDVASGDERIVLTGLVGARNAPLIRWNDAGTHLLVIWPVGFGV